MKVKDSDRRTNKRVILDIQQLQSNRLVGVTNMVIDTKNGFHFHPTTGSVVFASLSSPKVALFHQNL